MTREEAKKKAELMLAYAEGKDIQCKQSPSVTWCTVVPNWNFRDCEYRIKPEPKYRPFKSEEEVLEAIKEKGNILKSTISSHYVIIQEWSEGYIWTASSAKKFEEAFNRFTFADGTPFGKLEE